MVPGWERWAQRIGYLILAAASIWGVYEFATGDAAAVASYWRHHVTVLPFVLMFAALDLSVEVTVWTWIYHRFGSARCACQLEADAGTGTARRCGSHRHQPPAR